MSNRSLGSLRPNFILTGENPAGCEASLEALGIRAGSGILSLYQIGEAHWRLLNPFVRLQHQGAGWVGPATVLPVFCQFEELTGAATVEFVVEIVAGHQ